MLLAFLGLVAPRTAVLAQQTLPGEQAIEPKSAGELARHFRRPERHRFWDKTNVALFAGVGAARALDFTSTGYFRARGYSEGTLTNEIVDNKPLFAGIQVAVTAASIGVSYCFHRTGHHRLERWVSVAHIGVTAFGAARNYGVRGLPLNTSRP